MTTFFKKTKSKMPITSFVLHVFIQLITDKIKENLTLGDKNSATNQVWLYFERRLGSKSSSLIPSTSSAAYLRTHKIYS